MPSATSAGPAIDAAAGLRVFERVADRWALSTAERLAVLGVSRSTYGRMRTARAATLNANVLERISHVLGIYKALHVLFPADDQADSWIDRPSAILGDRPARALITSGAVADLVMVRRYLDAQRG